MTDELVAGVIATVDTDANGSLNEKEFHSLMAGNSGASENDTLLLDSFNNVDKDRDGYVSRDELRASLALYGEEPSDETVDEMMKGDTDGDGKISYSEFMQQMSTK